MINYNPFKMIGSYIGGLIGFSFGGVMSYNIFDYLPADNLFKAVTDLILWNFYAILWYTITGFVCGWSVHCLIKDYKENKN